MCEYCGMTRSAYYRWLQYPISGNERENWEFCALTRQIHSVHPDMGYRRIRDELAVYYGKPVNDKRSSSRSWGSSPLVTEFKYYMETEVHKVFLSAILDLCDRRLVAYKIRSHNDNELNMATFYEAVEKESGAHPLIHSDRGVQYTSLSFWKNTR